MANKYEINLGINFGNGSKELKNIKTQINNLTDNTHRIRIDIDNSRLLKQIEHAKKELKNLNNLSGNNKNASLDINTKSLEGSLNRIADIVDGIKLSLGTLDDKVDAKNLISSVNQIANALDRVTDESNGLLASLDALSKKDFSVNLDIKMGGNKSAGQRSGEYGIVAKEKVIPQLQQQAKALENFFKSQYKAADEYNAIFKLMQGTNVLEKSGVQFGQLYNDMIPNASKRNLSTEMTALKQYIALIKEAAQLKGFGSDINNIISGFESPDKLVQDARDIQSGAKEAKEFVEQLKNILGSGIGVEQLSAELKPIIESLQSISAEITKLSQNNSIDSLTASFNKLSETLDKLMANATAVQQVLNSGAFNSGISGKANADIIDDNSGVKEAQQVGQKIGETITQSTKQSLSVDDVIDQEVLSLMENYGIVGDKGSKAFNEIRQALVNYRKEVVAADNADDNFDDFNSVFSSASDIGKVTSALANNMKVADQTKDTYRDLAEYIKAINNSGAKIHLPESIRQEYGDDFRSMRSQLGAAFTTGDGMDFETFVVELNSILGNTIDLSHGAEAAFGDLVNKVNSAKGGKLLSGDEVFAQYPDLMDDMQASVVSSLGVIEDAEKKVAQVSENTTNIVTQNQQRQAQQAQESANDVVQAVKKTTDAISEVSNKKEIDIGQFDDDTVDAKELNAELTKLQNLARQIGQLDFKIVKGNYNDEISQVKEFERQLQLLKTQYNATLDSLNSKGIDINSEDITKEFVNARSKIAEFEAKVEDTKRKLAEGIKSNINTTIARDINKAHTSFDKLSKKSDELRASMKAVDDIKIELDTAKAENNVEGLIDANTRLKEALERVNALIDIQSRSDKAQFDDITLGQNKDKELLRLKGLFEGNSEAAKKFGKELKELEVRINACGDSRSLKIIGRDIDNLATRVKHSNLEVETFGSKLKRQFSKYSAYFGVAEIFMYIEQGLRDMFEQVKLIDSAMTELKKVTDETDASYDRFLSNAALKAKEIGTTIDGLVSSTADFARLGYGFEDAQGLAEVANIYAVVGDEIDGVEQATESLISTMAAFKNEMNGMSNSDFAMSIIDKFNEIGNNFAISSGGIGEALERSASSLNAANNTIDESIALITASNQVVQDPEAVGRFCRH